LIRTVKPKASSTIRTTQRAFPAEIVDHLAPLEIWKWFSLDAPRGSPTLSRKSFFQDILRKMVPTVGQVGLGEVPHMLRLGFGLESFPDTVLDPTLTAFATVAHMDSLQLGIVHIG
jgi:hypothetical protein